MFDGVFIIDPLTAPAMPAASIRTPVMATRPPVTAAQPKATPAAGTSGEFEWAGHRRLPLDVVRSSYPWLSKINLHRSRGGDFVTNCMLAAIGTDLSLKEAILDPEEDPALRAYYQVPPSGFAPREHIRNLGKGEPVNVPGYAAITEAMTKAGRGARGIVIVGVQGMPIGHVFNVVHDENGVVFLDGQQGRQAVLPARFQSLEFLPTSDGFPRESVAVSATRGQPHPFLGAYGMELETAIVVHGLPPGVEGWSGCVLAVNKSLGYQAKIDNRWFFRDTEGTYYPTRSHFAQSGKKLGEEHDWPIVEFVSTPYGATGQPHDTRAGDPTAVMASIREKLEFLAESITPPWAREVFPAEDGWELFPAQAGREELPEGAADRITLDALPITAPGSESLVLYPQYTAGVPLTGMYDFLKYAVTKTSSPVRILSDGLDFGDELAQRFVKWRFGVTIPRTSLATLGEIESVAAIRGMTALVFPHIVAQMMYYPYPKMLVKNTILVASRVAFAGIRQQLPGDAKTFLAQHAESIRDSLQNRVRLARPDYDTLYYEQAKIDHNFYAFAKRLPNGRIDLLSLPIPDNEKGITIGDYLDNALLDRPAHRVDQTDGIGMGTQFDDADTNEGRLTVPLIPVELRGFGPYPAGIHDAEQALTSIDDVLGPMYDQAQHRLGGINQTRIHALLATARTPIPTARPGSSSRPSAVSPAQQATAHQYGVELIDQGHLASRPAPDRGQAQRGERNRPGAGGAWAYMAGTNDGMVHGLRQSISDRQNQITADLIQRSGRPVDETALQTAYDNDTQLRSLHDALASWITRQPITGSEARDEANAQRPGPSPLPTPPVAAGKTQSKLATGYPHVARRNAEPPTGSRADPLAAFDWQESSHSLPPNHNGVKACVSVAVVDLGPGMGR